MYPPPPSGRVSGDARSLRAGYADEKGGRPHDTICTGQTTKHNGEPTRLTMILLHLRYLGPRKQVRLRLRLCCCPLPRIDAYGNAIEYDVSARVATSCTTLCDASILRAELCKQTPRQPPTASTTTHPFNNHPPLRQLHASRGSATTRAWLQPWIV